MARRKRRDPEAGEFEDPLKDYSPPDYSDPLEHAMLEGRVADMKIEPYTALGPQTSVEQTLARMGELNIACVMIVEAERLLGIISERDVLHKIADRYEQVKTRPVSDFMTPSPVAVRRTDSPAKALNLMAVSGFRHLPIINVDDKVVGILGPRRVTTFLRQYFGD